MSSPAPILRSRIRTPENRRLALELEMLIKAVERYQRERMTPTAAEAFYELNVAKDCAKKVLRP